jgi:hypothetical protein
MCLAPSNGEGADEEVVDCKEGNQGANLDYIFFCETHM